MARIHEILAQPSPAAGMASGCAQHLTHFATTLIEQPQAHEGKDWQFVYSCESVAHRFDVDVEQLLRWNPSLSSGNCVLQPGVSYCVVKIEKTEAPSVMSPDKTAAEPPICTFDPEKGEYVCDDQPPICTFDPRKGEYVCPESTSTGGAEEGHEQENVELK